MKKLFVLFTLMLPLLLTAALGPNVSVAPDGRELKWEEGAWDFFIMHKSLIEQVTGSATTTAGNPQADTCIDQNIGSTYKLTPNLVPNDADVDRAFLIWLTGHDPDNMNTPTDNSVTLTFTNSEDPTLTLSREITASYQGMPSPTSQGGFEFETLYMTDNSTGNTAVYTYRVEVTDFMKEIVRMGEERGMKPGEAIYGDYNVKGMACSNHQNYLTTSGLVGGWALPFVYTSAHIAAKKIYIYHGLAAYRFEAAEITVGGFELPSEAQVRLGLLSFEGDPGLASATGLNLFGSAEPEGLAIKGQHATTDYTLMANECNPFKTTDSSGIAFNYTEVFNSISSVFGWQDEAPFCIGDPNNPASTTNPIEYAIDADVFMIDAKTYEGFADHLQKGDTQFNLKIGANQDQVYTNFMIVSVDTKTPAFDIPQNPQTPDGREKTYCSCANEEDAICADRPFYYMIKLQNWGEYIAYNVTLQDTLPSQVEYVPGTTEMATKFDQYGNGTDWKPVEDVNGGFPFAQARKVADQIYYCDKSTMTCEEGAWIRFVVRPKDNLAKNEVIKNSADITDDSRVVYHTNSNIPLRLKLGTCPLVTECELPPKTKCGGVATDSGEDYCTKDTDCKDGKKCIDNVCTKETAGDLSSNATIEFAEGVNSPDSSSSIIIPRENQGLVLGQFYLLSTAEKGNFSFNGGSFKMNADPDVFLNNFKLYKDTNSNGIVDEGDVEIASAADVKSSYFEFTVLEAANRLYEPGVKHNFLVVSDAKTTSESGQAGKFHMIIEGSESFKISDSGTVDLKGNTIDFATYRFEPTEGFIFTRSQENDPAVPNYKNFNGVHPMLLVRTKSIGTNDAIQSITVRAPGDSVKFGEGIKSLALYIDRNGDGAVSPDDVLVSTASTFDNPTTIVFNDLANSLQYMVDEQKYLLFVADFKLTNGQKAKIQITKVKVKVAENVNELPVNSKEFVYEYDPTAEPDDEDGGGCAVTALPTDFGFAKYLLFIALALLVPFAARKER